MLKYLELCVDLRKSHLAKEGLYQYKNICQQVCVWRMLAQTSSLFVRKSEVRDYIYSVYICILLSGKYQITGGCG